MGMSIYEGTKIMNRDSLLDSKVEVEARNIVIDAVRKYQKIVEIVRIVKDDSTYSGITRESLAFQDIVKVVEDGRKTI